VLERLADLLFQVPPLLALGTVFGLTCAEAALFFGFVIPGEIAVVLGGVLASRGTVALTATLAAAIAGAVIGDAIGFLLGRRFGSAFLEKRFPRRWPPVARWIHRRGAVAVFLGRSTAFLRAIVPTAAGAARMAPARFLLWNVLGGVSWATAFTLVGYFAGEGYEAAMRAAGKEGAILFALIAVLALLAWGKHVFVRRLTPALPPES
jgi:membrane protein DedA with SNARE-associated domain